MQLQPEWTKGNTDDMELRGYFVRADGPDWIRSHLGELSRQMPAAVSDLAAEGRDGTGLKTEIPWFRLYSQSRSPKARFGFYVVYLFDAPGDRVFVSLNQGTTRWEKGDFHPLPAALLSSRVDWARRVISDAGEDVSDLLRGIDLQSKGDLGRQYELGNVLALSYARGTVPPEPQILEDLARLSRLLGHLYTASDSQDIPGDVPAEVAEAEEASAQAAGREPDKRTGFRPNADQRRAIELRAMKVTKDRLEQDGWTVKDVSRKASYDLEALRDGVELHVEVKGTTSDGSMVLLTHAEVMHHLETAPRSALAVVSSIQLEGTPQSPAASGGVLTSFEPWKIDQAQLQPISYRYFLSGQDQNGATAPPPGEQLALEDSADAV